jgi:hypothetical protein
MLYARRSALRTRQLLQDVAFLAWVLLWIRIGQHVHDLVGKLGTPPDRLAEAGRALRSAGGRAGSSVDDLPVVGDRLAEPFSRVGDGGDALVRAGEAGGAAADDLALALGLIVALLPIAYVAFKYLPDRLRWIDEAGAADALVAAPGGTELFALRALANQPLKALRRVDDDPYGPFRAGRVEALAALELRRLGLDVPTGERVPG